MAAALPAAIGVGSSLIGGIQGKGAAKQQRQLAEKQLAQLQPLINQQLLASQFGLDQARGIVPGATNALQTIFNQATGQFEPLMNDYRNLLGDARSKSDQLFGEGRSLAAEGRGLLGSSLPYLQGAATALGDLQKFYRPFMFDGQRAIDRFLPSKQRTEQLLAPEFGAVNQGFKSASENIARFAPRGGGRVSSMARADTDRQGQLSSLLSRGREGLMRESLGAAFQGAGGQQNVANSLQALGLGQGQLGLGTIGQGLNTINSGTSLLGTGGNLAQNSMQQALQALGLGGSAAGNLGQLGSSLFGQGLQGSQGGLSTMANLYGSQANRAYGSDANNQQSSSGLGGFLVDLFNKQPVQDKMGDLWRKIIGGGPKGDPGYDY